MNDSNPIHTENAAVNTHLRFVANAILDGRVIPFLGAGFNVSGRPLKDWVENSEFLPSSDELSNYLAFRFGYPSRDTRDLMRVTQYIAKSGGWEFLYGVLRKVLMKSGNTILYQHEFLARLAAFLSSRGEDACGQLIVTTNYDDLVEKAFDEAKIQYDLVTYIATPNQKGRFRHCPPGGKPITIERPNEYVELSPNERTVILKIHGAFDRQDETLDSYVITEDDYIEYLSRIDISDLLPVTIRQKFKTSHFLFLGYGLRDWNLRVILFRIWQDQGFGRRPWAVQLNPEQLDIDFWQRRGVDIINSDLLEYLGKLDRQLQSMFGEKWEMTSL